MSARYDSEAIASFACGRRCCLRFRVDPPTIYHSGWVVPNDPSVYGSFRSLPFLLLEDSGEIVCFGSSHLADASLEANGFRIPHSKKEASRLLRRPKAKTETPKKGGNPT